jgi:pimeloyl-ACP methyl ester carboxylesterase
LARELARDTRVVCIDVAGRGDSGWLSSPLEYHFPQFIADIQGVIGHLGLKEVHWVGTSMGGLLGMLLASTPSHRVASLVMNDIGAYVPLDALQAIARNLEGPARFVSLDEVEAHMRHTHREWGEIDEGQWRHFAVHGSRPCDDGGYRLHYDPRIARVARPFPLTPGLFMWDAWYRIRCPVLMLRGEHSRIFPRSVAQAMLAVRPEARLVEIDGCGHVPSLMSAHEIGVVHNFIASVADKGSWPRQPSYSFPGSSRMPTRSGPRSRPSPLARPAS